VAVSFIGGGNEDDTHFGASNRFFHFVAAKLCLVSASS
jgi:hypothetical protein